MSNIPFEGLDEAPSARDSSSHEPIQGPFETNTTTWPPLLSRQELADQGLPAEEVTMSVFRTTPESNIGQELTDAVEHLRRRGPEELPPRFAAAILYFAAELADQVGWTVVPREQAVSQVPGEEGQ